MKFEISAFSDEVCPDFDKQIDFLKSNGLHYMEIRGVNGKPIAEVSLDEARELKKKLDESEIKISAIGSPIGKININDDFDAHMQLVNHVSALAKILDTKRLRVFSFYMPDGEEPEKYKDKVIERFGKILEVAREEGLTLCLENEKGLYGDTPERILDIYNAFDGEVKCVFDHANFICCNVEAYPYAYEMLKDCICYMHIKDADANHEMVVAGEGIGRIPETIQRLKETQRDWILTLEPHLMEFSGLSGLETEGHLSKIGNKYKNSTEAFEAAIKALKQYIKNK